MLVAVGAGLLTLLAVVTSVVDFDFQSRSLHVAFETAAAMISLLAGQLILGRYVRTTQLADLLLGAALTVLAFGNLALSAVPAVLGQDRAPAATWGALLIRTLSAILLASAAWTPPRPIRHPARVARIAALGGGAIVAAVLLAVNWIPAAAPAGPSPRGAFRPGLHGDAAVLALQAAATLLYAAAAWGFTRRADRSDDRLLRRLAVASVLATFSRLNYVVDPSLGASWFSTGDLLRLAFFLVLLSAGVHELRWAQRRAADAAVLQERHRIARDIHDGMAQDMAFVVQQARALRRRFGPAPGLERVITAAQRALDESREAVATLVQPPSQPLSDALAQTAREAAEREGATVATDLPPGVAVPGPTQEAMVRVLREAVINAARHGGAERIEVRLSEDPTLCLSVSDDGHGFDVERAAATPGRHGLRGMAERVRGIGGELSIDSEPGRGTRVRMVVR